MPLASLFLCLALSTAAEGPPAGTLLTYQGTMVAAKEEGAPSKKTIELTVLVAHAEGDGTAKLLWTLDESGRGKWSWLDHFGTWTVDA